MSKALVVLYCVVCAGCAARLEAKGGGEPQSTEKIASKALADGVTETKVDATSDMEWQRLDLDTGEPVAEAEGWDLAFSRARVLTNGGVTGDADVAMALLTGVAFDDVMHVPSDATFDVDHDDSDRDTNTDADNLFNGPEQRWYDYKETTHVLTPHDDTYLIRSSEQRYFKLRIESYYDEAKTSGMWSFRWAEIEAGARD